MTEDFPTSATDFYAARDDRTNRCVSDRAYQTAGCIITADPDALASPTGQVLLATACNLLSRWCRRVELALPHSPQLGIALPGSGSANDLVSVVLDQMHDADPFGAFSRVAAPSGTCRLQLHIGSNPASHAPHVVLATASGWYAGIATDAPIGLPLRSDGNILGAIAAACISGAQLFKIALGVQAGMLLKDGTFDLYHLQWANGAGQTAPDYGKDLGRVLMIGAGSVGSAAAFFMRLASLVMDLTILDGDPVKIVNFNRSPIFGKHTHGLNKAYAVRDALAGSSITAASFDKWWDDFIRQRGRQPNAFDVWLPLANEYGVRWSIQNNYPPLMIQASTGQNWTANFGRHIPFVDDCLLDRFPEAAQDAALACSTGTVVDMGTQVDAALPFLSFFAGLLIVADLCRLTIQDYPQVGNYGAFDLGGSMEFVHDWNRQPGADCFCQKGSRTLWDKWNAATRYSRLTAQAGTRT